LRSFSRIFREQAIAALEQAKDALLARANLLDECLPKRLKGGLGRA
jgi:hypothetical protein